ncbi:MAG TPA: hypothetical protein VG474_05565 [Solirubrobacteraceae bacterium]|nr:hypothetical protein [Solirubrobacteraceae bacterium]
MAEEETTDATKLSEATPQDAEEKHGDVASEPGASTGHGVEASHEGWAPPDSGRGEAAESEVPTGVDELPESAVQAAQAQGGGDEGEGGDSGALDVGALLDESGGDAGDEGAGDEEEDAGT